MPKKTFFNLPDDKRERIAELAIEEFSERPYSKASISRMVERAGIAKGSFYQYFEDKLDVYRWLMFDYTAAKKLAFLKEHPAPTAISFFEQLEHLFLFGLKFGLTHPRLSRAAASLWHFEATDKDLATLAGERQKIARENFIAILKQGQAAGQVRTDVDLQLAAEMLLAMAQHGIDMALKRRLGVDLIEFCTRPELADAFSEPEQKQLIAGLMSVLRRGLEAEGASPASSAIDLTELPHQFQGKNNTEEEP